MKAHQMTKHLTKPIRAIHFIFTAFLMMFGTQVNAAQTLMVCDVQRDTKFYFKLYDPLIGKSQFLVKAARRWVVWEEMDKSRKSFVYDMGAKLVDSFDSKKMSAIRTTILDFEFGYHQSITRIIRRDEDEKTIFDIRL